MRRNQLRTAANSILLSHLIRDCRPQEINARLGQRSGIANAPAVEAQQPTERRRVGAPSAGNPAIAAGGRYLFVAARCVPVNA
jgi:hypothetical protein